MTTVDATELVERADRFFDEIERGEWEAAVETVAPRTHREVRFTSLIASEIEGRTYVGLGGLREWFRDFTDTFEIEYRNRDISLQSNSVLVALYSMVLRGKGSTVEIEQEAGTVWELEDGLVVRAVTYPSHEEASKAAKVACA